MDYSKDKLGITHKAIEAQKCLYSCINCKADVGLARGRKNNCIFFICMIGVNN